VIAKAQRGQAEPSVIDELVNAQLTTDSQAFPDKSLSAAANTQDLVAVLADTGGKIYKTVAVILKLPPRLIYLTVTFLVLS
jgi:hypothetical protein